MNSQTLSRQKQRLDWLTREAANFRGEQLELQAHWARYLCVLAAGFLENALPEIYTKYARASGNSKVSNYVESMLQRVKNPKARKFLYTARLFDRSWETNLSAFLDAEGRKDAIDAIISNRNLVAHGKDSGITLARVQEYLKKSIEVIEFIEAQCQHT